MVPGIGAIRFQSIMHHVPRAEELLRWTRRDWQAIPGIGGQTADQIRRALHRIPVDSILHECEASGVGVTLWGDADYPALLAEIPDPPPVLFWRGNWESAERPCVAVVGSRHMSRYGERVTRRLVEELTTCGVAVVSGLARGVDRIAHETAVQLDAPTIAVMGSGHGQIYPREHLGLHDAILGKGLVLSEYRPRAPIKSSHFPQRNRIIAGLSHGVVVVEAAERSGALITVRHALEQNREVFAVPGHVGERLSRGCHQLIKDGAKLVESAQDILEELTFWTVDNRGQPESLEQELSLPDDLDPRARQILTTLGSLPAVDMDQLVMLTGLPIGSVLAAVSELELHGLIRPCAGGKVLSR
jgi:DNA processing protein